ncbi:MAG TPA: hypothetical protein VMQ86_16455 [Bryobacteraceae bacterium]|jgi:hypothetical protein|nr:hypothetical protein [Bryobacteraceae bacterium]
MPDAEAQNPYGMNVRRMDSHNVPGHSASRNILKPESIAEITAASSANAGYATGRAVNRVANWWHAGSLPGRGQLAIICSRNLVISLTAPRPLP